MLWSGLKEKEQHLTLNCTLFSLYVFGSGLNLPLLSAFGIGNICLLVQVEISRVLPGVPPLGQIVGDISRRRGATMIVDIFSVFE